MLLSFAAFVQQFVYRPDRGQHSVLLAAHPANGGQQSQLAVDYLPVAHGAEAVAAHPQRATSPSSCPEDLHTAAR